MNKTSQSPILDLADKSIQGVLAIVIGTEGPSYRSVGATMVFADDGSRHGSLSSGCIESDLAIHAKRFGRVGLPVSVIYGRGSPFMDIVLLCRGGLEILLIPQPTDSELEIIAVVERDRAPVRIAISKRTGRNTVVVSDQPEIVDDIFHMKLSPQLRFCVFGKGPEAMSFAHLAQALGYEGMILSPDPEMLQPFQPSFWPTILLHDPARPENLALDAHTAAVLFFHDHEWGVPILTTLLESDAFYISAQGSKQTSINRLRDFKASGATDRQCRRILGSIGLIASTRDPQTLAVSVMTEILATPHFGKIVEPRTPERKVGDYSH